MMKGMKKYMKSENMNDEEFEKKTTTKIPQELLEAAKNVYGITDEKNLTALIMRDLDEMPDEDYPKKNDEKDYDSQIEEIQNDWIRQGKALENIIPGFNLEAAFSNPDFVKSVVNEHKTIAEAYGEVMKKKPQRAIAEIGNMSGGVSGNIRHDVKTMSDSEFDEYIKKIKNS